MNILNVTYIAPFDTLISLFFLIINSSFCLVCSKRIKFNSNDSINFILINIIFYLILCLALLFFSIFSFNLKFLRFIFSFLIFVKILFIFKNLHFIKKKLNEVRNYLLENKLFSFVIFFILILVCSPTTDADSLDYHLGAPLEIIRSGGLFQRSDDWLSHRLIQSGEMINLYGLIIGSKNFGQIFQILPVIFLYQILNFQIKNIDDNQRLITFLLFSSPLLVSILLSQKQILFPSVMIALTFSFLINQDKFDKKTLNLILILILAPVSFKYSYLIYSIPLFLYLFFTIYKKIKIFNFLGITFVISLIIIFPYYFKNYIFYGDPITPFFEWLKATPSPQVIYFAEELRYSTKIFKIFEIPIIPFFHIIPYDVGKVTLLITPAVLIFYFIIFDFKNLKKKNLIILSFIIFLLMSLSGKSLSRFYFDFYLMIIMIFLINYNFYKNKIVVRSLINISKIYFIIFIIFCSIGIAMFSKGSVNPTLYNAVISKYGFGAEESNWINKNIKNNNNNVKILYDREVMRTKIFHKYKFDYINYSFLDAETLKNIIRKQEYTTYVISDQNFTSFLKKYFICDMEEIKQKKLKLRSRNFFNNKVLNDILLIDKECLKLNK